ncbi:Gti1/Pac2 family-domain-containing protein [Lobosporangium transversale]|uniref:Gti1/Pac2 family-domain-containing protein n=1 Tax=Lobosporangium transversale TaxID=64571 RepID=A0A1Y2GKV9_9FUNG|nr:Gti1/Pac2 family-domain-containing protein [Lobosporangium transversale]ORZ12876.1 Gti1/Pac2 family-domain-containing protein [Lobosporangium transversale]|eukprot:XP_021880225.1 Gti1/Pac2 family-domain-containing protein [Lobosporangium transversale]
MDHNSMETYFGLIRTPQDALIIFEACRLGRLSRVHRRLSDIERQCVRSGSVYCFDEREAGMRRWTDGKSWSPSRVTGSFLTYRELDDSQGNHTGKNVYRDKGLLKQSFSITTVDNQKLHLISYFTNDDVHSERLRITPSTDPRFADIMVPKGIYPETPSVTSATAEPTLPTVQQSSPSPNMPYRNRQRPQQRPNQEEEDPSSLRADAKAGPHHHRRSDSSSSMHSSGHRRTNSGSHSLREHRYSPIHLPEGKHLGLRSRSNSNLAIHSSSVPRNGLHGQQRYKSSSPGANSFPSPGHSPVASWASDDEQPLTTDVTMAEPKDHFTAENVAPIMIPALRELAPVHHPYENNTKDRSSLHEQDSLSVLANLATHTLLLPKLEPKEISREKTRWVEDDRQLRALSSMLRL